MKRKRFSDIVELRSFVDGAVFATGIALVAFMCFDIVASDDAKVAAIGSLLVALLTLSAAWIALAGNKKQLEHATYLEDKRRENSLIAARAVLPAVLSEMMTIASNNLQINFEETLIVGTKRPFGTQFMKLPERLIPYLKECIQHADSRTQRRFADILCYFSMLESRDDILTREKLTHADSDIRKLSASQRNAIEDAVQWAVTHALIEDTLRFAQGGSNTVSSEIPVGRVRGAFVASLISLSDYPFVEAAIANRVANGRLFIDWSGRRAG
jgi:hypothetical protein